MNAIWIDSPSDAMNIAAAFRLSAEIPSGGAPVIRVAAADFYRLWIDGRLAAHGPARAAHGFARVDKIPIPPGRRATIFAEVQSVRVPCFDGVDQPPFFAAEVVAGDGSLVASSSDFEAWRDETLVQRVRRYSYQRGFVESRRVATDPAAFRTGGAAPEGWRRATAVPCALPRLLPRSTSLPALSFHDAGAPVAEGPIAFDMAAEPPALRSVTLAGTPGFRAFAPSEWEDDSARDAARLVWDAASGEKTSAGGADDKRSDAPRAALYNFGRTITGFISLRVRAGGPAGATILALYDEIRAPENAKFPVDPFRAGWSRVLKWRLAPGAHDLLSFHPASVRFAAIAVIEGAAEIERVGLVDFENPDKDRAALPPTGDATLDAIVRAARETFAQNSVDLLTDCPSRERAGWLFDSMFTGRSEALFTGRNTAERDFLENYALCPEFPTLPRGMLPMCYPSEVVLGEFLPNWTLWWILELAQYRARTGDDSIVEASRSKIPPLLDWFAALENSDGLVENEPGWVFVEWSACNDKDHVSGVNFPTNFLYAAALEAAAKLLGRRDLAEKGAAVRATAARLSWNGQWFEDNAVRDDAGVLRLQGHVTETGQYYAFYFGAATPQTHQALWETLREKFGPARDASRVFPSISPSNAIPGAFMRLELLLRHGHPRQVLDECRGFFAPMAALTGTLWEHLGAKASMDHGFASSAAWLIHRALSSPAATPQ